MSVQIFCEPNILVENENIWFHEIILVRFWFWILYVAKYIYIVVLGFPDKEVRFTEILVSTCISKFVQAFKILLFSSTRNFQFSCFYMFPILLSLGLFLLLVNFLKFFIRKAQVAAFLLNRAITRPASGSITFEQPFPSYMQNFIKIGGAVLEKNTNRILTLRNFNKD